MLAALPLAFSASFFVYPRISAWGGIIYSGLAFHTSVINQVGSLQACQQASLTEGIFSIEVSS